MIHFRYLLIKNHDEIKIKTINGRMTKDGKKIINVFESPYVIDLYFGDLLSEEIDCKSSRNYLSKIIRDLKNTNPFPLVERISPQKGKLATYVLTKEGERVTKKFLLNWLIENRNFDTAIIDGMLNHLLNILYPVPHYGVEW